MHPSHLVGIGKTPQPLVTEAPSSSKNRHQLITQTQIPAET